MTARSARASASRTNRLPGSDELFRRTSPADPAPLGAMPRTNSEPTAPTAASVSPGIHAVDSAAPPTAAALTAEALTAEAPRPERRSTGRERHDEKITVYVSSDELIDLDQARLSLKRLGVKADRGRIVREALAELIADLELHGEQAVLVRRLLTR